MTNEPIELKGLGHAAEAERRSRAAMETFADHARAERLLDVALGSVESPIGELMVAVTPRGLAAVAFDDEDREGLLVRLARHVSPRILASERGTDEARRELEEYFAGERMRFEMRIDRRLIGAFAWDVLRATRRVPFGGLASYGQIAARIGRPSAARAVGRALGSNPIPIVIPCHRVVGSSGALTGYGGGLSRKRTLLILEGSLLAS